MSMQYIYGQPCETSLYERTNSIDLREERLDHLVPFTPDGMQCSGICWSMSDTLRQYLATNRGAFYTPELRLLLSLKGSPSKFGSSLWWSK